MIFIEEIMLLIGDAVHATSYVSCIGGVSTWKAAARPPHSKLCEPVEEFVPGAGEGEEPGAAVVEA